MKKRKFYGVLEGNPETGVYRACVKIRKNDNPKKLCLDTWIIPSGKYARRKIINWEDNLNKIKATYDNMKKENTCDPSRPTIEFYRREDTLYLFLPILPIK